MDNQSCVIVGLQATAARLLGETVAAWQGRACVRGRRYKVRLRPVPAMVNDAQHRTLQINYLKRKAANLGFQIIEAPAA
jgi:hypothetical protein